MSLLSRGLMGILVNGLALYLLTLIITIIEYSGGVKLFIIAGIFLGIVNTFVKPLLKIVSIPFILLTAGLFLIVINIFILWFLTYFLDILQFKDVFLHFPNILSYAIGGIVFGAINWAIHILVK